MQELLAPQVLRFYDCSRVYLGSKDEFGHGIEKRTGIPGSALQTFSALNYNMGGTRIAQIMAWAAGRRTTRIEDRAYSLLGLFDINMPLLYGEGEKAFYRLQEEIAKESDDVSLFAWSGIPHPNSSLLASSPDAFLGLHGISGYPPSRYTMTKSGILGTFHVYHLYHDIYAVALGNWKQEEIAMLIREELVANGHHRFRQVNVRDYAPQSIGNLGVYNPYNLLRRHEVVVEIEKQVFGAIGSDQQNARHCFSSTFADPSKTPVVVRPALLCSSETTARFFQLQYPFSQLIAQKHSAFNSRPLQGIYIRAGSKLDSLLEPGWRPSMPDILVFFGLDQFGRPVLLASRIEDVDAWQPPDCRALVFTQKQNSLTFQALPSFCTPAFLEQIEESSSAGWLESASSTPSDPDVHQSYQSRQVLGTLMQVHFYQHAPETYRVRVSISKQWDVRNTDTLPPGWRIDE